MLNFAAITPHPPIIIPEIGGAETAKTSQTIVALKKLGQNFGQAQIETTIVISPHGHLQPNVFTLGASPKMTGDFSQFGAPRVLKNFENNLELVEKIKGNLEKDFSLQKINYPKLDHGILVPLYYLFSKRKTKLVPLFFSFLSLKEHWEFGRALGRVLQGSQQKISLVASGDLSHCLSPEAPGGLVPQGKIFDETLLNLLRNKQWPAIIDFDAELIKKAGECGLRSIVILLGVLSAINPNFSLEILSYEAPFGVGYLVAQGLHRTG